MMTKSLTLLSITLLSVIVWPARGEAVGKLQMPSWSTVTVGVSDLDDALGLWVNDFGFRLAKRRTGPDSALARLWSIEADDVVDQALVRSKGAGFGMVHLVEFDDPEPPVRRGAQVFDSLPKNLGIYVTDMPARLAELAAAGRSFNNATFSEVTAPNGIRLLEMPMQGHDQINIVLLEILGGDSPSPDGDFAGVGPLTVIVDNAAAEKSFYRDVIGLEMRSENILDGPEIEAMIGLPPDAELDVTVWGEADQPFGQIEVIDYRGVAGNNRYPLARPKSLGILHVSYAAPSLAPLRRILDSQRVEFSEYGEVETLFGTGSAISFRSPAGFRIEVHERRR